MNSQVISRFEGRNFLNLHIELTEKQKCVMIGSDCSCKQGQIKVDEKKIAVLHCRVFIRKEGRFWKTFVQEKAMNSQIYETYVNDQKLEMRQKQLLWDNDEIRIGNVEMRDRLVRFVFHDEYTRREEERLIKVPKQFSNRFKNYNLAVGKGAHSVIYRAQRKIRSPNSNGPIENECVCKIVLISKNVTPDSFRKLCQEPIILESLNHASIIKVFGYFRDYNPDRLLIWQEKMEEDLEEYFLKKKRLINKSEWLRISFQILDALEHLHSKNIVHRDIKPSNIMWTDDKYENLKIIDFGLVKDCSIECPDIDRDTTICGTPLYTPPEIYNAESDGGAGIHDLYKPSVDIWAFGVLSFYFLSGHFPFFNEDEEYDGDLLKSRIPKRKIPKEPLKKKQIDESIIELITDKILNHDHRTRITANAISDFFISINL